MTTTVTKPPYRIPLLSEVREIPHNGLNVVSTFSGCGGSGTGYRMAGYKVLAAVEFVPDAANSYRANMATYTKLLLQDVRKLTSARLLAASGMSVGEIDLFDGSPPCEPFSTAGGRDRTWNKVNEYSGQHQRTDDLFFEYARLVKETQPKCFVAENVTGLVKGRAKGYFIWIMQALRDCGYRVKAKVLDASWLGVPQSRKRVIFVGVRNDLNREPVFPAPLPYQYTVRDAIGDLLEGARLTAGDWGKDREQSDYTDKPARTVMTSESKMKHEVLMGSFSNKTNPPEITDKPAPTVVAGDSMYWHVELPAGYGRKDVTVLDADKPTTTVTQHGFGGLNQAALVQESQRRKLTIAELKRICGFPDDYILTGSFSKQWERLGDSVVPPMAYAVSRELRDRVLS